MKKYIETIQKSPLFKGVAEREVEAMLGCLSVKTKTYAKNEFAMRLGESTDSIGMVLGGSLHIIKEDFWGNRNIVAEVGPGQIFAESYACVEGSELDVSVVAAKPCTLMFMNVRRVLTTCGSTCGSACEFHARLLGNLLSVLAKKNLSFNDKLTHMTQRTTRRKLLSYLSAESLHLGTSEFDIPFDRQQLADYLSVDRSAMSLELSKMRSDGLIDFCRNHFILRQG